MPNGILDRLTSRPQYRAVARGRRTGRPSLVLQAAPRTDDGATPRFGFTVTSKTGNAVVRNRILRRLKAAAVIAEADAAPATDYVVVGKREAVSRRFDALVGDLAGAMRALRRPATTRPNPATEPDDG